MPNGRNISRFAMRPLDDLFEPTTTERQQSEQPSTLSPDVLKSFLNHPFKVRNDEELSALTDSIRENGIVEPILCRPDGDGGYEIVSGHRRLAAAKQAGLSEVPVTIRELDDDTATLLMVDANLHREKILPSEKAFAYQMKINALERKRASGLVVSDGRRATEIVGEESGENYRNVMRYVRLTKLHPNLLEMVDRGKIKFHPAVELSYLKLSEQETLLDIVNQIKKYPSLTQAKSFKQLSKNGTLDGETVFATLLGERTQVERVTFAMDELRDFFPISASAEDMKDGILDLLEARQRSRSSRER